MCRMSNIFIYIIRTGKRSLQFCSDCVQCTLETIPNVTLLQLPCFHFSLRLPLSHGLRQRESDNYIAPLNMRPARRRSFQIEQDHCDFPISFQWYAIHLTSSPGIISCASISLLVAFLTPHLSTFINIKKESFLFLVSVRVQVDPFRYPSKSYFII